MIAVGEVDHIIDKVREKMSQMFAGREIGAVISDKAHERIAGYVARAEATGAKLALDGRELIAPEAAQGGNWIGPSIIDHAQPDHESSCNEIFGPTLTIIRCKTLEEALDIENANPFGNAAAIYTSSGLVAQHFTDRASAGMIGINIGVPVPREPFPFGGWNASAFGDGDLTGPAGIDFWSKSKKITTKWVESGKGNWMS